MLHNKEILIESITKNGNKVLIWGACERNDDILGFLRENGINVVGYIDRDYDKNATFNSLPVYSREIIKENSYFVYVGLLNTYDDIISFFKENNYNEFEDYWYPCKEITLDGGCTHYNDIYGNEYNAEQTYKIDIRLKNAGKLTIGKDCMFKETKIVVSDNSSVVIGDCAEFNEKSDILSETSSKIHIGKNFKSEGRCIIMSTGSSNLVVKNNFRIYAFFRPTKYMFLWAYKNSELIISENVTICVESQMISAQNSRIFVGKDCMFSSNISVRAGNGHNMFDMETGKNLNIEGKTTIIGEHVWVGVRAMLFSGCDIGDGSIVGANTFVNKKFPKNCSIAGNPARIIKENIAWRREGKVFFENYEDFAEFDFR